MVVFRYTLAKGMSLHQYFTASIETLKVSSVTLATCLTSATEGEPVCLRKLFPEKIRFALCVTERKER